MRPSALTLSLILLAGCGGGGVGGNPQPDPPTPETVDIAALGGQTGLTVGGTIASIQVDPGVGDTATNAEQRAFFSFPLGALPAGATLQLAQLQITQITVTGTPYDDFSSLLADHVDLGGALDAADHAAAALSSGFATLAHDASVAVLRTVTVTNQVADDLANARPLSSFRLRFVGAPGSESAADNARFELDEPGTGANLHIVYLP